MDESTPPHTHTQPRLGEEYVRESTGSLSGRTRRCVCGRWAPKNYGTRAVVGNIFREISRADRNGNMRGVYTNVVEHVKGRLQNARVLKLRVSRDYHRRRYYYYYRSSLVIVSFDEGIARARPLRFIIIFYLIFDSGRRRIVSVFRLIN